MTVCADTLSLSVCCEIGYFLFLFNIFPFSLRLLLFSFLSFFSLCVSFSSCFCVIFQPSDALLVLPPSQLRFQCSRSFLLFLLAVSVRIIFLQTFSHEISTSSLSSSRTCVPNDFSKIKKNHSETSQMERGKTHSNYYFSVFNRRTVAFKTPSRQFSTRDSTIKQN